MCHIGLVGSASCLLSSGPFTATPASSVHLCRVCGPSNVFTQAYFVPWWCLWLLHGASLCLFLINKQMYLSSQTSLSCNRVVSTPCHSDFTVNPLTSRYALLCLILRYITKTVILLYDSTRHNVPPTKVNGSRSSFHSIITGLTASEMGPEVTKGKQCTKQLHTHGLISQQPCQRGSEMMAEASWHS
jgi:hypothetical protein